MKLTEEIWLTFGYHLTETSNGQIWNKKFECDKEALEKINKEVNIYGLYVTHWGIHFPTENHKKYASFYMLKPTKKLVSVEELLRLERIVYFTAGYESGKEKIRENLKNLLNVRECTHEEN